MNIPDLNNINRDNTKYYTTEKSYPPSQTNRCSIPVEPGTGAELHGHGSGAESWSGSIYTNSKMVK